MKIEIIKVNKKGFYIYVQEEQEHKQEFKSGLVRRPTFNS